MPRRLPTASAVSRAKSCVYPWTSGKRWAWSPENDALKKGNAFHACAESYALFGDTQWQDHAATHGLNDECREWLRDACEHFTDWYFDSDDKSELLVEKPYAYNTRTRKARQLIDVQQRGYKDAGPDDIVGTADLIRLSPTPVVIDYKTGRPENVQDADANAQLHSLAAMVARAHGFDEVAVEIVYVDASGVFTDSHVLDVLDLGAAESELLRIAREIDEGVGIPKPGAHCKYCPILADCEATKQAIEAVSAAAAPALPLSVEIQSPEHGWYVKERLQAIKDAVATIERAVNDYARSHTLVSPEGEVYGLQDVTREEIPLTPEASEIIARLMGPDKANELVEEMRAKVKVPKTAINRAIGTKRAKAVYDALREAGLMRTSTFAKLQKIRSGEAA